jgi:hypothetical protein
MFKGLFRVFFVIPAVGFLGVCIVITMEKIVTGNRVSKAAPGITVEKVTIPKAPVDSRPDCFETAQNVAFALNPVCQKVGLFSSEGRAALAACNRDIEASEKTLKESGQCQSGR